MIEKEAIKFLMEQGIEPNDRIVTFNDANGNERIFLSTMTVKQMR